MKVAQSSLVEEPFNPVPAGPSPLTAGIDWKGAPPLLGYNSTKVKPTAQVALATELGEPLLASWRYGLGQTAAFTQRCLRALGGASGWAGTGTASSGRRVARGLLRKADQATFQVRTRELGDGGRLRLDIDALTPAGGFRDGLPIDVTALDTATGQGRTLRAAQTAPGSYRAEFDLPAPAAAAEGGGDAPATTMFSVNSPELPGSLAVFGHTRSYPREFLRTGTDEAFLRGGGGGRRRGVLSAGRIDFRSAGPFFSVRREDFTNYFLAAALFLLPLDIFLRRRTWRSVVQPTSPEARWQGGCPLRAWPHPRKRSPFSTGDFILVIEVIRYAVTVGEEAAFEDAYRQAGVLLGGSGHCLAFR